MFALRVVFVLNTNVGMPLPLFLVMRLALWRNQLQRVERRGKTNKRTDVRGATLKLQSTSDTLFLFAKKNTNVLRPRLVLVREGITLSLGIRF